MPKLIECTYCKKIALYEEKNAKLRENGEIFLWNCRYCLSQVTYKVKSVLKTPKIESEITEDIEPVKVIEAQIHPLPDSISPLTSSEQSPTTSPPSLDPFPVSPPSRPMIPPKQASTQAHEAASIEVEHSFSEIDEEIIPHEFSSQPAILESPEEHPREQSSPYERRIRSLLDEMEKVREQNKNLERKMSFLTRRKSFIVGSGLLVISFLSIIVAYLTKDILIEGFSILAFFFGVSLLLISSDRYVKSEVATLVTISPLLSLHAMLYQLGGIGPAVYLPPVQDEKIGKLFVPWESNKNGNFPSFEEVSQKKVFIPDKGALLLPVGSQLLSFMEEDLDTGFIRGSLKNTLEAITRTLTLKTGLAQKAVFIISGPNHIELTIIGSAYSQICQGIDEERDLCGLLGCPICSMIASLIAKATGEPVVMDKSGYDPASETTIINFQLRGWTEPHVRVSSLQEASELKEQPQEAKIQENTAQELENLPILENPNIWFDTKVEQGYCPICEAPLDPKTGNCTNCGMKY